MSSNAGVQITWLGHATFLFTMPDGATLLVDPFVDSNPSCPEEAGNFERLDHVAITHGHEDHVADAAVIDARHAPKFVALVEVAAWLGAQGIAEDRIVGMNKGGTVRLPGVSVTMVNAHHSSSTPGGDGPGYGGEPAGLVLRFDDGPCVYHAGDTCVFGDMALIAELYRPDIALLPIGDHYTMGPFEAAKACELLGVPRVVPMHYGTWPILTGTPDELRRECEARGVAVTVETLEPGGSLA